MNERDRLQLILCMETIQLVVTNADNFGIQVVQEALNRVYKLTEGAMIILGENK